MTFTDRLETRNKGDSLHWDEDDVEILTSSPTLCLSALYESV